MPRCPCGPEIQRLPQGTTVLNVWAPARRGFPSREFPDP